VTNGHYNIIWTCDEIEGITYLANYLETQGDFSVKTFKYSIDALDALMEAPPDLFIVDLMLSDGDGLSIAKTARVMKPSIPIVTVTEYLGSFAQPIALALAERTYPFAAIYEKSQLESLEAKKTFATELRLLCQQEYHVGEITRLEDDYAQVTLRTPKGDEYSRFFETEFLEACGISKAGDGIELFFWKIADGTSGDVHMRITKRAAKEDTVAKAREIISKVDLGKIREKFRPPET
jgi:CheY-like chemotaxis protein